MHHHPQKCTNKNQPNNQTKRPQHGLKQIAMVKENLLNVMS